MLLSEVQLECFKAAFRPEPVPLGAFNVLIGRNGSGKSTLLEALQWLDVAIRRDAREACDRYFGVRDLVHVRTHAKTPYFRLCLRWDFDGHLFDYEVVIEGQEGLPVVAKESLHAEGQSLPFVQTFGENKRGVLLSGLGSTLEKNMYGVFPGPEVLALETAMANKELGIEPLEQFWSRAVFLRLSPNRLAQGSSAVRKSFEPLLDEEGQTLPALLRELTSEQLEELALQLEEILPGIRGVQVSEAELGRDTKVHYSLLEEIPGADDKSAHFAIPAWMLSEGTRRITAILALLMRDPAPSLLCIEEIENGLDPWTVIEILRHLQSAADRGVQVILTTHSPWLLDHVPMDSILQVRRIEGDTRYERFCERPEIRAYHPNVPAGTRYINEA